MSFIRGVYAHCIRCCAELNVRTDVVAMRQGDHGFLYRGRCATCGTGTEVEVTRQVHLEGIQYVKQVATNRGLSDLIVEPVSNEEAELGAFAAFLDTASTETIWSELYASS